jgi:hypothetical protein
VRDVRNIIMKSTPTKARKATVRTLITALIFTMLTAFQVQAAITIVLAPNQTGNYWWNRTTWMNGSYNNEGFSYGDTDTGLIHSQSLYYYYGGADRYLEAKDIYFQIPLDSLDAASITSVSLNFYLKTISSPVETFLKHLDTQSTVPTGDVAQKLAGATNLSGTSSMVLGWNEIDITDSIISDLNKGYAHAVFSLPRFSQEQDQNRVLSIYGASAADVEGSSVKPFIAVAIPEPGSCGFVLGGLILCTVMRSRRRVANG